MNFVFFPNNLSSQKEKRRGMKKKKRRENAGFRNLHHACTESLKVSG